MITATANDDWASLIDELERIRGDMLRLVEDSADALRDVHPVQRASARNLLHYLALRSRDLRPLQARLAAAGLSSLGRAESRPLGERGENAGFLSSHDGRLVHSREPEIPQAAVIRCRPSTRYASAIIPTPSWMRLDWLS